MRGQRGVGRSEREDRLGDVLSTKGDGGVMGEEEPMTIVEKGLCWGLSQGRGLQLKINIVPMTTRCPLTAQKFASLKHRMARSTSPSQLMHSIHGSMNREAKISSAASRAALEAERAFRCDAQKRHAY